MSRPLAVALYAGLCVGSVLLWLSQQIEKACSWTCPCGGPR